MLNGRWDLVIHRPAAPFPSWLEVEGESGRLVGIWGSARPIGSLKADGGAFRISIPPQYEGTEFDLEFKGLVKGDRIAGEALIWNGEWVPFTGERAPILKGAKPGAWSAPEDLLAMGLGGFALRSADSPSRWTFEEGILKNAAAGSDILTKPRFDDIRLTAEYRYPQGSNSGIYLRGRYEVQIVDDHGQECTVQTSGGIYGFHAPIRNAARPAGEVNRAEITLCGRWVEVALNDEVVVPWKEIPGITGGALDSREGEPGPILLQGDHGPVEFLRLEAQRPAS